MMVGLLHSVAVCVVHELAPDTLTQVRAPNRCNYNTLHTLAALERALPDRLWSC